MYTVYFTLLTLGFAYQWTLLISIFVLIIFQTMINNEKIAIERISSYIRVFFENQRDDMHWSLFNKDEEHLIAYRTQYQNIGWYIHCAGASILSAISMLTLVVTSIYHYGIDGIPAIVWVELITAALMCGIVWFTNSKMYVNSLRNRSTITLLDNSVKEFYKKCQKTNKSRE